MENGTIERTTLLQPNQVLQNLNPGEYEVTGGKVTVGHRGSGTYIRVLGIDVNGREEFNNTYQIGQQPYNKNFASVLYELRAAGLREVSRATLDAAYTPKGEIGINMNFISSYMTSQGLTAASKITLSSLLINGIAR